MTEPIPIRPATERFKKYGLGWAFETEDGILLSVDHIKRRSDELHGVLKIQSLRPGESGHLHAASHNFSSFSSRSTLAKGLKERTHDVDWRTVLEQFCVGVMNRVDEGDAPAKIGRRPRKEDHVDWVVHNMVPKHAMTWWYGAKGTCKSQTAALLAVCLTDASQPFLDNYVIPHRVGILDWEDNDVKWERYLQQIANGLGIDTPEVDYQHCSVSFQRCFHNIAKWIDGEGLDFLIVDSFAMAAGAPGEHHGWEEIALAFAMAWKELNTTALVIDHVSHDAILHPERPADPAGSQQKLAQARAGYELRMEKEAGSPFAHVGVFDRKHTMVRPIGLRVTWDRDADSIVFEHESLLDSNTEMANYAIPLAERLMFQLKRGSQDVKELADRLSCSQTTCRSALNRLRTAGKVQKMDDRYGLSAQEIYGNQALSG